MYAACIRTRNTRLVLWPFTWHLRPASDARQPGLRQTNKAGRPSRTACLVCSPLMHLLFGAGGRPSERRLGALGRRRADKPILHVDKVAHRVEMQIEQLELVSLR